MPVTKHGVEETLLSGWVKRQPCVWELWLNLAIGRAVPMRFLFMDQLVDLLENTKEDHQQDTQNHSQFIGEQ